MLDVKDYIVEGPQYLEFPRGNESRKAFVGPIALASSSNRLEYFGLDWRVNANMVENRKC